MIAGFIADLAASVVYVPSEVLKTRLQLQGRYNNPFSRSGYNYKSTWDATRTIVRYEGLSALFYGYKATLVRDLPFSALQFAFYEEEQKWAKQFVGGRDIGLGLEILTATTAGGMAGVITCPLDVVKTRIQTQANPPEQSPKVSPNPAKPRRTNPQRNIPAASHEYIAPPSPDPQPRRFISTSSPNTTVPKAGSTYLNTSSILTGLKVIYKTEGVAGLFRGVGPRLIWTSVQSGTMLVFYQAILRQIEVQGMWKNGGAHAA